LNKKKRKTDFLIIFDIILYSNRKKNQRSIFKETFLFSVYIKIYTACYKKKRSEAREEKTKSKLICSDHFFNKYSNL